MKKTIRLFLIAGLSLLALSCQKADKNSGEIRFSASAEPSTKTVYGDYNTDFSHQDINWVQGDQIYIWSNYATVRTDPNRHYFTYNLVDIDGRFAKLSGTDGLVYSEEHQGETDYNFKAIYPATGVTSNINNDNQGTLTMTIPQNQGGVSGQVDGDGNITFPADMSYAYMRAEADGCPWKPFGNTDQTINLKFYPFFTAFEISVTAQEGVENMSLRKVSMDGRIVSTKWDGLTGNIHISVPSFYAGDYTNVKPAIYTFPEAVPLVPGKFVTFTIIALPDKYNSVDIYFELGDGQIRQANLSSTTFAAMKKHRLYGLAVPGGFKIFSSRTNLEIDPLEPVNDQIDS